MTTPASVRAVPVSDVGERGLIERIRRRLPPSPPQLLVGIGDDAAVAAPDRGALNVLTTDVLVEGVHFDRRFSAMSDVGYKAVAVNLSDVAAMGGVPRFVLLSLLLPASTTIADLDDLIDGLLVAAAPAAVAVAGGNLSRSPGPLVVDVTLVGSVGPRKVLRRDGGRPGDALYVTGSVGGAAAGLAWLRANATTPRMSPADQALAECVARYRRPAPRTRVGTLLGRTRSAGACIDLSDGLADAVRQLAEASGAGARIDAASLPIHPGVPIWCSGVGQDAVDLAVAGGDDYELLFAVPPKRRSRLRAAARLFRGVPVTEIGELTADRALVIARGDHVAELPVGYVHF